MSRADSPQQLGYSHARRMGAASRHLALAGRTRKPPGPASSSRCRGIFARDGAAPQRRRGGAHQRVRRRDMEAQARRTLLPGDPPGQRPLPPHPHQRAWCRDHGPIFVQRDTPSGVEQADRRLGLQRVGRQVSAVRPRRRRPEPRRRRARHAGVSSRHRPGRRVDRRERRAARCSRPRRACSTRTATRTSRSGRSSST